MAVRADLNISLDGVATPTDPTSEKPMGADWERLTAAYTATLNLVSIGPPWSSEPATVGRSGRAGTPRQYEPVAPRSKTPAKPCHSSHSTCRA